MSPRYGRQAVLQGWSPALQARLGELLAVVPGSGPRSEVCALYLVGAGVGAIAAEAAVAEACRRLFAAVRIEALTPDRSTLRLGGIGIERIDTGDPVADGAGEASALLQAVLGGGERP